MYEGILEALGDLEHFITINDNNHHKLMLNYFKLLLMPRRVKVELNHPTSFN